MKRGIQVKFRFIQDILECTKIDKVLKILNTKEIGDSELINVLKSIKLSLTLVNKIYCDELELFVSIKDNKYFIAIEGYDRYRAFRQYIHKNYTVESFTKKNHIVERELKELSELVFNGCLSTMMNMSVSVPTATVNLFIPDDIKKSIYSETPVILFEKFIEKYEKMDDVKDGIKAKDNPSEYIKTLDNCTEKINTFFNDLNNILKRIPNHGRLAEEYILELNMALKKVFSDTVFVTKRYNEDVKYELIHYKFDNIFKDNKSFDYVDNNRNIVSRFIQLLLDSNNISGLMIDDYNNLIMPVGNKLIAELQVSITNVIELVKVIERDRKDIKHPNRDLEFITINMDMEFVRKRIKDYMIINGSMKDVNAYKNLIINYSIDVANEYNEAYNTDFVIDVNGPLISHEATIIAPIVNRYIEAVKDFDFKTIDECVSEIPEGFKFKSEKEDNKIIVKYGRGVF